MIALPLCWPDLIHPGQQCWIPVQPTAPWPLSVSWLWVSHRSADFWIDRLVDDFRHLEKLANVPAEIYAVKLDQVAEVVLGADVGVRSPFVQFVAKVQCAIADYVRGVVVDASEEERAWLHVLADTISEGAWTRHLPGGVQGLPRGFAVHVQPQQPSVPPLEPWLLHGSATITVTNRGNAPALFQAALIARTVTQAELDQMEETRRMNQIVKGALRKEMTDNQRLNEHLRRSRRSDEEILGGQRSVATRVLEEALERVEPVMRATLPLRNPQDGGE